VILQPGDHAWLDVTVPRGHPLWDDDVERATHWLGEAWCAVLRDAVGEGAWSVHRGKLTADATQRAVCFAAVGPGEVLRDGRKVVGVSQRRTKDAARFQCTVFRAIETPTYSQVLRHTPPASLAHAVGVGERLDALTQRTVARLTELLG
jgi:lipoate-protein ligase A